MTTYAVRAKPWDHGWELHVEGVGVTQSDTLDDAEAMVRDYIGSVTGTVPAGDEVTIRPEPPGWDEAPGVRDEFDEYLAEQMQDPEFRAAYEAAERRDRRAFPGGLAVDGRAYQRRLAARRKRKR